jgi:hypothetical protein
MTISFAASMAAKVSLMRLFGFGFTVAVPADATRWRWCRCYACARPVQLVGAQTVGPPA